MLEDGYSINYIHINYGINTARLSKLWILYQKKGSKVLRRQAYTLSDATLRHKVVLDVENNGVHLVQASIKYGVSATSLSVWLKAYRTGGIEALSITQKRGWPQGMGRPKKVQKPETELERFRRENQELRLEGHDLHFMLGRIKMARSTYYYNVAHLEIADKYTEIRKRISEKFAQHHKRCGYRRICSQLRNEGCAINHKTVQKLMREMHLKSAVRRVRYRSYKGEVERIAANVLKRDFIAQAPNRKWATDVTEFKIGDCKAYLSPILDMYNGEIIFYTISDSPNLRMVINMVNKAIRKVKPKQGLILHSDQGWHYQHLQYQLTLKSNGIIQSMSRKGNSLDNAMMENFF